MKGRAVEEHRLDLDVYIEGEKAVIWLHTIDGSHLKLLDQYHPRFYILPKAGFERM